MLAAPLGSGSAVVREHPIPSAGSAPYILASGSDGGVWFCENGPGKIGRLDPLSGAISEFSLSDADAHPIGIVEGRDGSLWFTENGRHQIGRLTFAGDLKEFPTPTSKSGPNGVCLATDGAVWFAEFDAGKIGRVGTDGRIVELDLPAGARPLGGAATKRHVWFTDPVNSCVYRIGVADRSVAVFRTPIANSSPRAIVGCPDEAVWFAMADGDALGRIGPAGDQRMISVPWPKAQPRGLALIGDELWFTANALNRVGRLTLDGRLKGEVELPIKDSGPRAMLWQGNRRLYVSQFDAGAIAEISI